jgi:hypothetical protein
MTYRASWKALAIPALLFAAAMTFAACDDESEALSCPPDQLVCCAPGDNIFCRCPGGSPGTKLCNGAGDGFDTCGPCESRETTGPGSQSSAGSGGNTGSGGFGSGGNGGGGGVTGDKPLFAKCEMDSDCQSATCRSRYCTKVCSTVSDCPYPASECVQGEGGLMCMPTCTTAVDCSSYDAPPSACGYALAVDNWDVTACSDWADKHELMPIDTDCLPFDHPACNLGYPGRERVCSELGVCKIGCYTNADCGQSRICSSQGTLGQCQ